MNREQLYVIAYPKSGSTWISRLLGEILDSPVGGSTPEEDVSEVATEGWNRQGNYVVRKGHFIKVEDAKKFVPRPHRMCLNAKVNEQMVMIVRDPRDICVSGAHYWRQSVSSFANRMLRGEVANCGRWDDYVLDWKDDVDFVFRYEDLLSDATLWLSRFCESIGERVPRACLARAQQNQSLGAMRRKGRKHADVMRRLVRKGRSGSWREEMSEDISNRLISEFGCVMTGMGYISTTS